MTKNRTCAIFGVCRGRIKGNYTKRLAQLKQEVKKQIEGGTDTFITAASIGYEMDIAEYVLDLKKTFPGLKLIVAQPFGNTKKHLSNGKLDHILKGADDVVYVSESTAVDLTQEMARWMIEQSNCIISISNTEGRTVHRVSANITKGKDLIVLPYDIDNFTPTEDEI